MNAQKVILASFLFTGSMIASMYVNAANDELIEQLLQRLDQQQLEIEELRREIQMLKAAESTRQDAGSNPAIAASTETASEEISNKDTPAQQAVAPVNMDTGLKLSGRVHRILQYVDDGENTDIFHTDSDQGPTILRVDADTSFNGSFTAGATIELGVQQNKPLLVSQDEPNQGVELTTRLADVHLNSSRYGKLSIGRGFMSSWYVAEVDLSGTQFASLLSPGMLFGGLKFVDSESSELSDTRVRDYFFDLERFLIKDRVRYDSIRFGGSTALGGSISADDGWDMSLRSSLSPGDFKVNFSTSYQDSPFLDIERRWDGVLSARHEPTGLNFTLGGFTSSTPDNRDPHSWVVKLGWLTRFNSLGRTAFSIDYSDSQNVYDNSDSGESWGAFVLQHWEAYRIQFYAGIRRYHIEIPGKPHEPITVIPLGILMSF